LQGLGIISYEQQFGSNPYGSDPYGIPAGSQIAAANQNYSLNGTANQVQTLAQIFDSAAQEEIQYLAAQYSGVLPAIQVDDTGGTSSSSFDVRSVDFYAASPTDQSVDASNAPYAGVAEEAANHILLGSETGDELIGGQGDDILIAQSGNETLQAGAGSDTLIANSGSDTLRLGGSSDVVDFVFPSSGSVETVIENNGAGIGSIDISGSQIGSGLKSTGLDTWIDQGLNTYQFVPNPSSTPAGYYPGVSGSNIGELKVVTASGNEIDIWGFDLSQAESSDLGFLGIALPPTVSLNAGSTNGVDPPAPDFTAGTTQSYTVSVDAPTLSAEAVTVTLTGAPASDFGLVSGTSVIPLTAAGTFTVTIPAGQASTSFSLVNTGDVGSAASLQLVASIPDPIAPTADTISSAALTQNYVEPTDDPFKTPSSGALYFEAVHTTPGGLAYDAYEGLYNDSLGTSTVSAATGANTYIYTLGEPNSVLNGGAGNDTIFADFAYKQTDGGVNVVNGNGGQDDILVPSYPHNDSVTGALVDGPSTVSIYGTSQTDLTTAVKDANTGTPTGQQGDLIVTWAPGTVVGSNGNDLILTDGGGIVVAGPGNDTIATGAPTTYTTADWQEGIGSNTSPINGVTWNTSLSDNQLVVGGSSVYLGVLNSSGVPNDTAPASGYEGNLDDTGGGFDTTDDTIFGGAGRDLILLSNGNEQVNLGAGASTVLGGMGSDTISGGSGSDCIIGGGGNDYIAAGSGNDLIVGRGGNNTIFGGNGADTIFGGGSDSNWATEEKGNNFVQAGSGNTLIDGSGGSDTLIGGSGFDTIQAGDGNESIVAGSGSTSINGGNGPDTIVAGSGSDTIWGSTQSTTIYGGSGADQIYGRGGTDVIYGGDGGTARAATTIAAGSGATTIYGGDGVDQISGGSGNDVIYAGDGGTSSAATQVRAGSGDTTIYGGDGIDNIVGGSGTDVLYAGDGGKGVTQPM
jgi:Ca2+-binding RTX toxin-like protein